MVCHVIKSPLVLEERARVSGRVLLFPKWHLCSQPGKICQTCLMFLWTLMTYLQLSREGTARRWILGIQLTLASLQPRATQAHSFNPGTLATLVTLRQCIQTGPQDSSLIKVSPPPVNTAPLKNAALPALMTGLSSAHLIPPAYPGIIRPHTSPSHGNQTQRQTQNWS